MNIHLVSFGFNHGPLQDTFLVVDVRSLKNPYHDKALRYLNGYNPRVQKEVLENSKAKAILSSILQQVQAQETAGVLELRIGIGCTGGSHRSVAIVLELAKRLEGEGYSVTLTHRDMKEVRT